MTLDLHIASAVVCSIILSLTVALGFTGNVAVFLVFRRSWRLRTWENAFHLNIATINLFMCTLQAPTVLFLLWDDNVTSPTYQTLCTFSQAGLLGLLGILVSHMQISVLRCIKVYHPSHVPKRRPIVCALVIPWFVGLVTTIQTYITESGILFVDTCDYKYLVKDTSVFFIMIIVLLTSSVVLVTSYTLIFVKLMMERKVVTQTNIFTITRRSSRPIYPPLSNNSHTALFGSAAIRHMVVSSVALLLTFLATAVPPVVTLIMFQRMSLPYSLTAIVYSSTFFAYFLSPFVYTFRNRVFKRTLLNLIRSNKVNFSQG